ncbi:MAG: hypothetical protein CVV41_11435 [Candidatus Riflebacteria bacterium HGW-Riflebacteria-1]|nr:MAG: hypothetical protein CVV41_11435 [Candidatus Riflebacteria bacterium HGW-Riflebacteria-1]
MAEIRCEQCSAMIDVPAEYSQPFVKCANCGAHQKTPETGDEPKYRLVDAATRARGQQSVDISALSKSPEEPRPKKQKWRNITPPPALASAAKKEAAARQTAAGPKIVGGVVDEGSAIEDALGSSGMEMLMQLAASYMCELNENAKARGRSKATQTLMRSRVPAELAGRALAYAEKSEEIEKILWDNYRSNMLKGLGIFAVGLVISVLVHTLAHPGWEFVLFQVTYAVGFAYAANAGLNMAGLKIPVLRNEMVHYGFIIVATMMILTYLAVGIWS